MLPAMETQMTSADPIDQYRRWATALFAILAIVGAIGGIIALLALLAPGGLFVIVLVFSVATFVAVMFGTIAGLSARRAWAIHAIAPICYVLVASGVLRSALALGHGEILFPLEAIGALLVMTRPHRSEHLPALTPADGQSRAIVVGFVIVTTILPFFSPILAR